MAAHFLRLRLAAAGNAHRRRPAALIGLLLGLAALAAATIAVIAVLVDAADVAGADGSGAVSKLIATTIILGSIITAACLILPLLFGIDDRNDPRQYAPLGLSPNRVAAGLAASTLISAPAIALIAIAITHVVAWAPYADAVWFAVATAPLSVATGLLAIRVATSLATLLIASRHARDIAGLVGLGALVLAAPAAVLLAFSDWSPSSLVEPAALAEALALTPLAAAWAAPALAAAGDGGAAWGALALSVVYLAVLAAAWRALVGILLVTPERERTGPRRINLGWFDATTPTPAGVIAARSLTYWGRDPRYRASVAIVPVVPLFVVAALATAGMPLHLLVLLVVPVMCLFLGWGTTHNDLAYDHSALWLHVASHTRGAHDRLGRLLPPILIGIPLILIGAPISAHIYGDPDAGWSVAALSAAVLLTTLGVSSVYSVAAPYPAAHPGNTAFEQPQTTETGASGAQAGSFILTLILVAPTAFLAWEAIFGHDISHTVPVLVGLGTGVLVVSAGVWLGGIIFDRRRPELLAFTLTY